MKPGTGNGNTLPERMRMFWLISSQWNRGAAHGLSTEAAIQGLKGIIAMSAQQPKLRARARTLLDQIIVGYKPRKPSRRTQ